MGGKRSGPVRRRRLSLLLLAALGLLAGCAGAGGGSLDTSAYPDPPEDERAYTLSIYWAFNAMGGEIPEFSFDREGIAEEGTREDPNPVEPEIEILELTPPGGRDFCFRGVSPGDVVLTMRNASDGKTTYECQYVLRVYEDLRLALLTTIED